MTNELTHIWRSRPQFIALVTYPLLLCVIFLLIFQQGILNKIPIAVVDQDSSTLSRSLISALSASPEVLISERVTDLYQAKQSLLDGQTFATLLIPPQFEQDMLAGHRPEITTFYNNQLMTIGSVLSSSINAALSTQLANIQITKLMQSGITADAAVNNVNIIPVDSHILFNPTLNYYFNLVYALFPAVLQIMMFLSGVFIFSKNGLAPYANHPIRKNTHALIIGKLTPYVIYYSLVMLIFYFVLFSHLGMPFNGHLIYLLIGTLFFISSCLLYGAIFALVLGDFVKACSAGSVLISPAFGYSGVTFPFAGMNTFSIIWGSIIPGTWFFTLLNDQALRGLPFSHVPTPYIALFAMTVVLYMFIPLILRSKLNQINKKPVVMTIKIMFPHS